MASLSRCSECGSFVVSGNCPNCGGIKVSATRLGVLATLFGSTAFAMTLMACYGCPDCNDTGYGDGGADSGQDAKSSSSSSSGGVAGDDDDDATGNDAGKDAGSDAGEDSGPKDAAADG
jgi:hypothetical protein